MGEFEPPTFLAARPVGMLVDTNAYWYLEIYIIVPESRFLRLHGHLCYIR